MALIFHQNINLPFFKVPDIPRYEGLEKKIRCWTQNSSGPAVIDMQGGL